MMFASKGLLTPNEQAALADKGELGPLVSPYWLISTYLVLTFGELLLSPMGISFVSKVAPPKYKGLMMGGWFGATAMGNQLVSVGGYLWGKVPLWVCLDRVHGRLPRRCHLHVRHDEAPREGRQVIPLNSEPQARNTQRPDSLADGRRGYCEPLARF